MVSWLESSEAEHQTLVHGIPKVLFLCTPSLPQRLAPDKERFLLLTINFQAPQRECP